MEQQTGRNREQTVLDMYRAALTWVCQRTAPVAHVSIDRRCLRQFRMDLTDDQVGAAICFLCGRRFPYAPGEGRNSRIEWVNVYGPGPDEIVHLPEKTLQECLGLETYWKTYGAAQPASVQEHLQKELLAWQTVVTVAGEPMKIVCCPEDKICEGRCLPERTCTKCKVPLCKYCLLSVAGAKKAANVALANDMLVFYAPRQIYVDEVSFMELVCASPGFTAMACFSLEKKILQERAMDQDAFMPRQRLVARGNATTFPLPWEDMLSNLSKATQSAQGGKLELPRVGEELLGVMNVIIKSGSAEEKVEETAKVIHQARVRRAVVVQLILEAKSRGHPAYTNVDAAEVYQRALALPEDGVPEEIIHLLPHDTDLDHLQRQKAATPVRTGLDPAEVQQDFAEACKPNAVVSERTTMGLGDINAQQVAGLHAVTSGDNRAEASDLDTLILQTGSRVLDQFRPWYFSFAFAYVFPFGGGMPDPPAWSEQSRYRRAEAAPRIELATWMRCMARRCEAQVNRDWVFGFASWNLFFRSAINLARPGVSFDAPVYDEEQQRFRKLTGADIEAGAVHLVKSLTGTYMDTKGNARPVGGDVTKLQYVPKLGPAARKIQISRKML